MGRLLRKKKTVKKKKPGVDGSPSKALNNDTEADKKQFSPVSSDIPRKKRSLPPRKTSVATKKDGYFHKATQFLREVRAELKKVTWPSRRQTIGSSVVVIILVIIIAFFLGMVDMALSSLIRLVLK